MDRRLTVIFMVCLIEAVFRILSGYIQVDGLIYTLTARLIEIAVILIFAYKLCGVETVFIFKELSIGLGAAAAFGAVVITLDLISRVFIHGGLLVLLIARQSIDRWMLYSLVGCLIGPFAEELFFRGLFYSWMRQRLAAVLCIILTSLLFASVHGHISMIQLTGGIIFASIYEWRKNIWAPFVVHALANIGIWIIPSIYPLM
jgi:hypothetical protein